MAQKNSISIRELHQKTGYWVYQAARKPHKRLYVTYRGTRKAILVSLDNADDYEEDGSPLPVRKLLPKYRAFLKSYKPVGIDSTKIVSDDRNGVA